MDEKFLQFIYQQQLFEVQNFRTVDGQKIEIVNAGYLNSDAGPDFFNAKLRIGDQLWVGNVELHTKSSNWTKHKHDLDSNYDNVILHVVAQFDKPAYTSKGRELATVVLRYSSQLYDNYNRLITNKGAIACSDFFWQIDNFYIKSWQNRLLVERFERKTAEILEIINRNKYSWEEVFYIFLSKNFGFKTNALPFEMLAKSLPLKAISKQKDNLLHIEAMLFGQGGFLDADCSDDYFLLLKREYHFLSQKYELQKIDNKMWKFLRLRPPNFPTIRIAQFAAVLFNNFNLFSKIIETDNIKDISTFFEVNVSKYWSNHYLFCKESSLRDKKLGQSALSGILINTVALFLFSYGIKMQKKNYSLRALELLEYIKAEKNSIIKKWERAKIVPDNAFESQALIELFNEYCKKGRCADCSIGAKIILYKNYS